jgi:hypothetical protein
MAAGDPGSPARYYSSTAVETSLQSSIAAQAQGQSNTSFIVASISGFPTDFHTRLSLTLILLKKKLSLLPLAVAQPLL